VKGFLYEDRLKLVAELDSNNNVVSRFVYASRSNVPDYMVKNGTTYRILADQLGSPRLVVDVVTGIIAERMDYDEFGRVIQDTNPAFQPFGFAGGLYDPDTHLVRFGARDYDAETGRWTARDPLLFKAGDTNLYAYTLNDPVNFTDAVGLNPTPWPANGTVRNQSSQCVIVLDDDTGKFYVVPPGGRTPEGEDIDFLYWDGKAYKIGPNDVTVTDDKGPVSQARRDPSYDKRFEEYIRTHGFCDQGQDAGATPFYTGPALPGGTGDVPSPLDPADAGVP